MKTKTNTFGRILAVALILFIGSSANAWAGESLFKKDKDKDREIDTLVYDVYKGKVLDEETSKPLIFATLSVVGENTATITNGEGEFILKVMKNSSAKEIKVSYLGYQNATYPINGLKSKRNYLRLAPAAISLEEVKVYPGTSDVLVRKVLEKIKDNYTNESFNMTGFYREAIQKRSSYVSLSEAIVDIYKAPYGKETDDQVKIFKGRKGTDVKRMDTLLFKLQGGPVTTLLLDIIKNPSVLLSESMIDHYYFEVSNVIKIDNKLNYVISFTQRYNYDFPLYNGRLYINIENLALTGADFSLNLEKPEQATSMFIRRKPLGLRVVPLSAIYSVNYREQNGKWFFNYARGEVKFKVKWDKKLFYTTYTTTSEIAITDRKDVDAEKFKMRERFRAGHILSDKVNAFGDKDYWGGYNVIEPDQSIESAIRKLKRLNK